MSEQIVVQFGSIDKDLFEALVSKPISDEVWKEVADEIQGRVENYIEALVTDIVEEYR